MKEQNQNQQNKPKALFLKLDGVVIRTKSGNTRPVDIFDWILSYDTMLAINEYIKKSWYIVIVSCQGSIDNEVSLDAFREKLQTIISSILFELESNTSYLRCYWSYNRQSRNFFPEPGLAEIASKELNLDLQNSIMVGTHLLDYKFSKNAGIGRYYSYSQFFDD